MSLRDSGLAPNSITVRLNSIFHFYAMNDVVLNKKKINMFKGEFSRKVIDRAYNHQEISKILQVSDLRMKVIILLMASTGMRIGALHSLKMRNLKKINGIYKVTVYEGSKESYFTFTTPECTSFIDSYLEFLPVQNPVTKTPSFMNTSLTEESKPNATIENSPNGLQILSDNSFTDSIGYFHVVGEVKNNSPTIAQFVQVTGTFYDSNNRVVGTQFTYTNPSDIGAGQKAPFDLILMSASVPISQIDDYNLQASYQ
jgi:hypothetical protein